MLINVVQRKRIRVLIETLLPLGLIMIFLYLTLKLTILILIHVAELYSTCFLDKETLIYAFVLHSVDRRIKML